MGERKVESVDVAALSTVELAQKMYPNEDFSRLKNAADSFETLVNNQVLDGVGSRRFELADVPKKLCAAMIAKAQLSPSVRRVVAVAEPDFGDSFVDGLDKTVAGAIGDAVAKRERAKEFELDQASVDGDPKIWRAFRLYRAQVVFESAEDGRKNVAFMLFESGEKETERGNEER